MVKNPVKIILAVVLSVILSAGMAFAGNVSKDSDISNHWAKETIEDLHKQGLIAGYEDNSFKPNANITRAEYVSTINKVMNFTKTKEITFNDVKEGAWYKNAVSVAVANGYCNGYEDNSFRPNANITRAEASVMLAKALNLPTDSEGAKFNDDAQIPKWAKSEIYKLSKAKHISGYSDGTFKAEKSITRAEAFTMISSVVKAKKAVDNLEINKDGEIVKDKDIKGNVTINKSVGEGDVSLENVKIGGDIIVKGGGSNSVNLKNVELSGKIIVEKEGVRVRLKDNTKVKSVEAKTAFVLAEENFKGKIGSLTIGKEFNSKKQVNVQTAVDSIDVKNTAHVVVEDNIEKISIAKNAKNTKIEVKKKVTVKTIEVNAKSSIEGEGSVKNIILKDANAEIAKNIKDGAKITEDKKPAEATIGGGGGGSSSNKTPVDAIEIKGDKNFTEDDQKITFKVEYKPNSANFAGVNWTIADGQDCIVIESTGNDFAIVKAINDGEYTLKAEHKGNKKVSNSISGKVEGQVVKVEAGSVENIKAGDTVITNVPAEKVYYLKSGNEFYAVDNTGKAEKKDSEYDAVEASKKLDAGKTEITNLDNSKAYLVKEISDQNKFELKSKALEGQVAAFLSKYGGADSVKVNNADLAEKEYTKISGTVTAFMAEIAAQENLKKAWEKHKQDIDKVNEKIQAVKPEREAVVNAIKASLESIKEDPGLTLDEAVACIDSINTNLAKLSEESKSEFPDLDKKDKLKEQVELYRTVKARNFELGADGSLVMTGSNSQSGKIAVKILLMKDDEVKSHVDDEISLNEAGKPIEFRWEMRKAGVGKYSVLIEMKKDNFKYLNGPFLQQNPIKANGEVEIMALTNTLERLEIHNADLSVEKQSSNIRFDKATGDITWEDVPNATSYDVFVDISIESTNGCWGKYYLDSDNDDYTNLQNEFEKSELTPVAESNNVFYKREPSKGQDDANRVMAGVGLTTKKISLRDMNPVMGTTFTYTNPPEDDEGVFMAIYIIPRNSGNYVTQELKYDSNQTRIVQGAPQVLLRDMKWSAIKHYFGM